MLYFHWFMDVKDSASKMDLSLEISAILQNEITGISTSPLCFVRDLWLQIYWNLLFEQQKFASVFLSSFKEFETKTFTFCPYFLKTWTYLKVFHKIKQTFVTKVNNEWSQRGTWLARWAWPNNLNWVLIFVYLHTINFNNSACFS